MFEEYDYPTMKTVNGIATTGPIRAAWFKDSEGNTIGIVQLSSTLRPGRTRRVVSAERSTSSFDAGRACSEDGVVTDLASMECVPCKGGVPPLEGEELEGLLASLGGEWRVVDGHHLEREYRFKDFSQALDYTNRVGELAEQQRHHPDIYLAWGKVRLTIWTHKIDGLTESDFVFAAKADRALARGRVD